ncbi:PDZ domain-containing protein [Streptomyces oceani]|uniref:PDZ/DHR/GLGF domain-containing protein n=1 Tax=Streptomyces oceani TaxID=1075402 RepID=A0A1E7KPU1_9ACTN|nr:PDZ domain-containing protein [Streptomyces oceani]OEV05950.1 PDZ/DHR/GLGF domain-containing protein [Streptomyces oceani]
MPRRTATMLASTLLLIAVLCAAVLIKVPYSAMSPGPTYNTLGSVDGEQVLSFPGEEVSDNKASGHLNMTTVRVTGSDYRMNLFRAIYGWLAEDSAVVPRQTLYPSGKSAEEVKEQNAEEFSRSQESAKVAALRELGEKVPTRVVVQAVLKDGEARGKLHAGDVIKSVDGTRVKDPNDVAELVTEHDPGEKVRFTVVPADKAEAAEKDGRNPEKLPGERVTVPTRKADDGRAVVGIQPGVAHTLPISIDITLADVGGPSAGLMFALGIVDKLTPEDLTDGSFVAGTGTIDDKGQVGPIGGIHMKTVAAREKGAEFFLTPKDNCTGAVANAPDGLILVKIDTMDDAMSALRKIKADKTAELPRCAAG